MKKKLLITNALTYANDNLHLGHMLGYVQSDIYARFNRLIGNKCAYICGTDRHGTPAMIKSMSEKISPTKITKKYMEQHKNICKQFYISFDFFGSTHNKENKNTCNLIYEKINNSSDIEKKEIKQFYDINKKMFLPDRFITGTCPYCKAKNQYGDNCEACGRSYNPTDLIDPLSTISKTKPVLKKTKHIFFKLSNYTKKLNEWLKSGVVEKSIYNKMNEWLYNGLNDWDISRDNPYYGFKIPNEEGNKFFYVWFDAPIAYISMFRGLCKLNNKWDINDFWGKTSTGSVCHFLGKDISYFHSLFWPALLMSANYKPQDNNFIHGFLKINNKKMSKSKKTFISCEKYLECCPPEAFRYYISSKISNNPIDIDLNLNDFKTKVNSDLIGKIINIISRCAKIINSNFNSKLSKKIYKCALIDESINKKNDIINEYQSSNIKKVVEIIIQMSEKTNKFINDNEPWKLVKGDINKQNMAQEICTIAINLYKNMIIFLKPILPLTVKNSENILNTKDLNFSDVDNIMLNKKIKNFYPLMNRITNEQINKLMS